MAPITAEFVQTLKVLSREPSGFMRTSAEPGNSSPFPKLPANKILPSDPTAPAMTPKFGLKAKLLNEESMVPSELKREKTVPQLSGLLQWKNRNLPSG